MSCFLKIQNLICYQSIKSPVLITVFEVKGLVLFNRWMSKLWNAVIAPRVQEAILSRASVKRPSAPGQAIAKKNPSQGQQAVVKAALSILLNKAVLHGCPLPRPGNNELSESRVVVHCWTGAFYCFLLFLELPQNIALVLKGGGGLKSIYSH